MQAIDRWRNWKPTGEKFGDSVKDEPTKPTKSTSVSFGGSMQGHISNFSGPGSPADHPAPRLLSQVELLRDEVREWDEAFHAWTQAECAWRERSYGDLGAFHVAYCVWAAAHDADVCDRETFEAVLACLGFTLTGGAVSGLIFKADFEAADTWKNPLRPLLVKRAALPAHRGKIPISQQGRKRSGGSK